MSNTIAYQNPIIWKYPLPTKVYTGGTFDLFHDGHRELLEYCRKFAGEDGTVIVGLNTDEFVFEYKGQYPHIPYEVRRSILEGNEHVSYVVENTSGADSKPTIENQRPDIIVIGMDWLEKDYCAQMQFDAEWLNKRGITLAYVPRTKGLASSVIRKTLVQKLDAPDQANA